jgi:hypothetical protein
VPNAMAIVRRIWLPGLDAGYDPQGLAVDGGGIYFWYPLSSHLNPASITLAAGGVRRPLGHRRPANAI